MRRVAAAVLLALAAPAHAAPLPRFPHHFLLGVATAAYQYEGGTTGTNWNAWEQAHPDTVEPVGRAVKHYLALLNQLRARHLEPIVTLDHFTWPEWLEDQAHAAGAPTAWEYPPSVDAFVAYVRTVVQALGPRVRYYITLNEPDAFLLLGYILGTFPPGVTGDPLAASGQRAYYHGDALGERLLDRRHVLHDRAPSGRDGGAAPAPSGATLIAVKEDPS